MSLFADYSPRVAGSRAELPPDVELRVAHRSDASALARLCHEREGGDLERHELAFETELIRAASAGEPRLWVATRAGKVIAYSRVHLRTLDSDATEHDAPAGWYLGGVVVAPAHRRLGIASALTRVRLEWLRSRTDCAFYVANALNRASLDLHSKLGFRERSREFRFPGVSFTGGVGVLSELRFKRKSD